MASDGTPTSRRSSKRMALAAIAFGTVATLVAGVAAGNARPLDEVVDSGTLVIAVYRDFPPFSYGSDDDLKGVDVDLGRAIAGKLGVSAAFMPITADENVDDDLRNAVGKGHYLTRVVADLMLHVPVDRQLALRNTLVAIHAPYFSRRFAVAFNDGMVEGRLEPGAIGDARIGVELDSLPDFFLTSAYGGVLKENVVHYPTVNAAARALAAGDVAALVAPQSQIEAGLGADRDRFQLSPVTMHGFGRTEWVVGVAVDHNSRDLGYAVDDIVAGLAADGTIRGIFSAHGISYRPADQQ